MKIRLWLPGYHTPSLNRTQGQHWSKVRRMKKKDAAALYEALRDCGLDNPSPWPGREVLGEARRVLSKLLLGVPMEKRRGKKPPKPAVPARLRFERVTLALLDDENFEGSTKGLTDCLRYAFPSLLIDDAKGYVEFEHVQTKCGSKCEQGTWVELAAGGEPETEN